MGGRRADPVLTPDPVCRCGRVWTLCALRGRSSGPRTRPTPRPVPSVAISASRSASKSGSNSPNRAARGSLPELSLLRALSAPGLRSPAPLLHRNVIHGSDSVESARREIALWFRADELLCWEDSAGHWLYE